MNYLTFFLLGAIGGLLFSIFFIAHNFKREKSLANKEDIEKITKEIEELKNLYKENYILPEAEKEFYYADEIN